MGKNDQEQILDSVIMPYIIIVIIIFISNIC